jgi:hypothetical protein
MIYGGQEVIFLAFLLLVFYCDWVCKITIKPNSQTTINTIRLKILVPLLGRVRDGVIRSQRSQTHPPASSQKGKID